MVKFCKFQGLGNDFIVVDGEINQTEENRDNYRSLTIRNICDKWLKVFQTNAIAPLTVSSHFLPHVMRTQGKIATLTSKMGSVSENSSGGSYIYRSSKSALNSIMKSLSKDLYSKSVAVCVLHPGWVKTEMGGPNAQISVETSAIGLRKVIEELTLSNSGKFCLSRG